MVINYFSLHALKRDMNARDGVRLRVITIAGNYITLARSVAVVMQFKGAAAGWAWPGRAWTLDLHQRNFPASGQLRLGWYLVRWAGFLRAMPDFIPDPTFSIHTSCVLSLIHI